MEQAQNDGNEYAKWRLPIVFSEKVAIVSNGARVNSLLNNSWFIMNTNIQSSGPSWKL